MGLTEIIAAVFVVIGILLIRHIADILPSLIACLLRWKECLNLENSMRLSSDRNIFTAYLIIPFCLLVARYRLYSPDFTAGLSDPAYFACVVGVFLGYEILRIVCSLMVKAPKGGEKIFKSVRKVWASFFCIMTIVSLIAVGICSFSKVSADITRLVAYYSILAVYLVFIFRKYQILKNSCSFLSAFLYLCVLEILPSGILVVSALFL